MKILVIGKSGYISKCFQDYMKKYPDYKVDAISVRDDSWKEFDFSNYDVVFNATGLAHNDARKGSKDDFIRLNVKLPIELANKSRDAGVSVFIHMSSMIVYGDMKCNKQHHFIDASTKPRPNNIYGKSKLLGEEGIRKLNSENFNVAIIRSPLVYSEKAVDNFLKLTMFALKTPVFLGYSNYRSMIYSDNLCELIRLIAVNKTGGLFFPQQEKHICTSKLIYDLGKSAGHRIIMIKMFNPIIFYCSRYFSIVNKVFGDEAYSLDISNHFDGTYRIVSYKKSVKRIVNNLKR